MNSRDAAYEEEVKAALEASRREMMTSQERELEGLQEQEQVVEEPEELEEEVKEAKKGKRKRDEPTGESWARLANELTRGRISRTHTDSGGKWQNQTSQPIHLSSETPLIFPAPDRHFSRSSNS